jgi:stage V sporulation protein S
VKSVAIARVYLQEDGIEITCVPMFVDVEVGGNERTAVRIEVTGHGAPLDNAARLDVD